MNYQEQFKAIRANLGQNNGYLRDPIFLNCKTLQELAVLFIKKVEQHTGKVQLSGRKDYNPNRNPLDLLNEFRKDHWIKHP